MNKFLWGLLVGFLFINIANAAVFGVVKKITVEAGNNQALIDAIYVANVGGDFTSVRIKIVDGPNGETGFTFTGASGVSNNALPVITGRVSILNNLSGLNDKVNFTGSGERDFRLATVAAGGYLFTDRAIIQDFGINGESGGAIVANGRFQCYKTRLENNFSDMNGGAIVVTESGLFVSTNSELTGNRCSNVGGAVSIQGQGQARIGYGTNFINNTAGVFGCDLNINTSGDVRVSNSYFDGGNCQNVLFENPSGNVYFRSNTITHQGEGIDSTGLADLFGNLFQGPPPDNQINALSSGSGKPQAACNDFGTGAFVSKGYNISTDNSCSLDQDTDQPNTDPMLSSNDDGLPVLESGSPAIDASSAVVVVPEGEGLASLPCGYVDINGMARPQDGNGDGEFECDSGASEFLGAGMVQAGHSGAFYNALRNGEGNYVEILNDDLAVVYTFTYRPDGSGPSWFIGVGDIRDNGIVIDELLRPIGTSFGDGFDPAAIDYSDAGSMSVVFPDCDVTGASGSVAYTGNEDLGYEGVLSRAQRITSITGCETTPTANAGLSGSFYDPARNGEGLIVEWLTNGDVIAIFFTFDQNGDQFWTFGVGTSTGNSVTINALYPAASTVWGRDFNPNDVDLQTWGTFELTWTDCNTLEFDYSSSVSGYGSGSLDYTRVSTLQGTACPQ